MRTPLSVLAILALTTAPALALSMAGSSVSLEPPQLVAPGDTGVIFTFYVYNGSVDNEWTSDVIFTFPDCFTVRDGTYDDSGVSIPWTFAFLATDNVASFNDDDAGYGEIYDSEGGYFHVTVDVSEDCPGGQASVHWYQQGDDWGADPHFQEGDLDFAISGTLSERTTWSTLKSLF